MKSKQVAKRSERVRFKLKKLNKSNRPRLSVFRSNKYIYAQIIDDNLGVTLANASSKEKDILPKLTSRCNKEIAKEIGSVIAQRAIQSGINAVIFDKSSYKYHGIIAALADAARESNLNF